MWIKKEFESENKYESGVIQNDVIVTIPVYRFEMSANEESSFRRTVSVFGGKHPIAVFAPEGLDLINYTSICPELIIERFPAEFFRSIGDYSRLLLSEEFYQRFSLYKWLLICQLDVWVFRDELDFWCKGNFDFIGAPISAHWDPDRDCSLRGIVGNGGFSLRRISVMLSVLQAGDVPMYSRKMLWKFCVQHFRKGNIFRLLITLLRLVGVGNKRRICLNILRSQGACEDMVFRMIENSGILPTLVLPSLEEAAKFALDGENVWKYFKLSDCRPPFALHAWKRTEGREFMEWLKTNPEKSV